MVTSEETTKVGGEFSLDSPLVLWEFEPCECSLLLKLYGWSDGSGLPELINVSVTKVGIQPPTAKFDWLKKKKKKKTALKILHEYRALSYISKGGGTHFCTYEAKSVTIIGKAKSFNEYSQVSGGNI